MKRIGNLLNKMDQLTLNDAITHLSGITGYDPSYKIIYYNSWSDYEEHGWVAILERDNKLYHIDGGYSVMGEGDQGDEWYIFEISYDHALEIINDWERVS